MDLYILIIISCAAGFLAGLLLTKEYIYDKVYDRGYYDGTCDTELRMKASEKLRGAVARIDRAWKSSDSREDWEYIKTALLGLEDDRK